MHVKLTSLACMGHAELQQLHSRYLQLQDGPLLVVYLGFGCAEQKGFLPPDSMT